MGSFADSSELGRGPEPGRCERSTLCRDKAGEHGRTRAARIAPRKNKSGRRSMTRGRPLDPKQIERV